MCVGIARRWGGWHVTARDRGGGGGVARGREGSLARAAHHASREGVAPSLPGFGPACPPPLFSPPRSVALPRLPSWLVPPPLWPSFPPTAVAAAAAAAAAACDAASPAQEMVGFTAGGSPLARKRRGGSVLVTPKISVPASVSGVADDGGGACDGLPRMNV